jgi:hypothetical protein
MHVFIACENCGAYFQLSGLWAKPTSENMMQRVPFETDADIETTIPNVERPIPFVVEPGDVCFCGQVLNGVYGYRMGIKTPNHV